MLVLASYTMLFLAMSGDDLWAARVCEEASISRLRPCFKCGYPAKTQLKPGTSSWLSLQKAMRQLLAEKSG